MSVTSGMPCWEKPMFWIASAKRCGKTMENVHNTMWRTIIRQFECEHTQNFCAVRRQKCLPKCLLGSLPEPSCLRRGADTPCLNFGTKCPKAEMLGNSFCCSPAGWKMWKVFSNIRAGHIIILPPQKPRLETLANRAFFRAKCSHISSAF